MPESLYIGGKAIKTEPYDGAVIDAPTQEAAVAELASRLAIKQAAEQRQVDDRAINALTAAKGDIFGLQQLTEMLRKDLDNVAQLNIDSADIARAAQDDAAAAKAKADAVPAVDVAAVARLSAEVLENGTRASNLAAQAQAQITALTSETVAQTEALKAEVDGVIGSATQTVEGIRAASEAAVEAAQADVRALLAATPTDVAASVEARLGEVEVLIGGQVNPGNQFEWQWQFAKLSAPEEITRTVVMPILPGWEGKPGRSQAVVGGGGGGSSNLSLGAAYDGQLSTSVEAPIIFRDKNNISRPLKGDATVRYRVTSDADPTKWSSGTLSLAATRAVGGDSAFTIGAELTGVGGDLDLAWRVVPNTAPNAVDLLLFATAPEDCRLTATIESTTEV